MVRLDDTQIVTIRNHKVKITLERDRDSGLPWEEGDGFGPVRSRHRGRYGPAEKRPGERVLSENWYYDFAGAIARAKAESWGIDDAARLMLTTKLGRAPRAGEVTAQAVENDFAFLKAWCDDEWCWYGYTATLLDGDGGSTEFEDSCWGFEYWLYDDSKNQYFFGQAMGAAEQLVADAEKELAAVREWNERDVMTETVQ